METNRENILSVPVEQLPLTEDCVANLKGLHLNTLQEIIDRGWQNLRETKGFDYICFNEVIRLMAANDIVHLMDRSN
jgi:hypothetical protein